MDWVPLPMTSGALLKWCFLGVLVLVEVPGLGVLVEGDPVGNRATWSPVLTGDAVDVEAASVKQSFESFDHGTRGAAGDPRARGLEGSPIGGCWFVPR